MATKITYTQQGDYLLPDLKLPEQPKIEIGIWDKRHLRYIKQYRPILYTNLLTKCELTNHLVDIDEEATKMFNELVNQIAKQEGVTEKLKADSQMLWVRRMNSIRNEVTKIVNNTISSFRYILFNNSCFFKLNSSSVKMPASLSFCSFSNYANTSFPSDEVFVLLSLLSNLSKISYCLSKSINSRHFAA